VLNIEEVTFVLGFLLSDLSTHSFEFEPGASYTIQNLCHYAKTLKLC